MNDCDQPENQRKRSGVQFTHTNTLVMSPFTMRKATRVVGTVTAAGILSLLAALPALAVDPFFKVHFDSTQEGTSTNPPPATGVKGSALFTFTDTGLELTLSNDTDPVQVSELVAMAFHVPDTITVSNPINFGSWNTIPGGSLPSLGSFDICESIDPTSCFGGGQTAGGIDSGDSLLIAKFTLAGAASATDYRDLFAAQTFGSFAMRFKSIDLPPVFGDDTEGSDNLTSYKIVKGDGPDEGPGDEVPGPLPIFGAAAAFGYSRKLRQRLKAKTLIG